VCVDGLCICEDEWGDVDCQAPLSSCKEGLYEQLQLERLSPTYFSIDCSEDIRLDIQKADCQLQLWTGDSLSFSSLPNKFDFKEAFVIPHMVSSADLSLACQNNLLIALQSDKDCVAKVHWESETVTFEMKVILWVTVGISAGVILFWVFVIVIKQRVRQRPEATGKALGDLGVLNCPEVVFSVTQLESTTCSVCLDEIMGPDVVRVLMCGHVYHKQCIDVWLKIHKTCCLCKRDLSASQDETHIEEPIEVV